MTDTLARRKVSRQEYTELPVGPPFFELIDGELIEMTRPTRRHYQLFRVLFRLWDAHLLAGTGGELAQEPNLFLSGTEDVYHPDLVYVRSDNLRICQELGIRGTPDVVCEILSPATERIDRYRKLEAFRRAGVPFVWLLDPQQPVAVEEYALASDGRYTIAATLEAPAVWSPLAFPGFSVPLAELDVAVTPVTEG